MTNPKAIGQRIKALRKARGETQDELAAVIGVSRSTLGGIESGNDHGGLQTMIALADHFKVPLDWLLCRVPPQGGPLVGKFIDDPDVLAWAAFWESLDDPGRDAVTNMLRLAPRDRVSGPK